MKTEQIVLIVLAFCACLTACGPSKAKEAQTAEDASGTAAFDSSASGAAAFMPGALNPLVPKLAALNMSGFKNYSLSTKAFSTADHAAHLGDPMKFVPLPDQGQGKGRTAVVGSRVCSFYPNARITGAADLASLNSSIIIPIGTIISISGDRVGNSADSDHDAMFEFQENWNWFYPTVYKGQKGLVFGADLYGIDDSNESNQITARLYQTGGREDQFYPVLGYHQLPAQITERIEKERIAIQKVGMDEYNLSGYSSEPNPDDMIALYNMHYDGYPNPQKDWSRRTPVFITTDLAAHAQHLMFDRTLQYLEEAFFLPRLQVLNQGFIDDLQKRQQEGTASGETGEKALLYFQVAKALLELAPERCDNNSDDYTADKIVYRDVDRGKVLSAYPEAVREEIDKIDKADKREESSVFSFASGEKALEDYTQYKPRGHYAKNGALGAYFRAMMWFGHMHFLIASEGPTPLRTVNGTSSDSTSLTLKMEPVALLITDVAKSDTKLYESWCGLFDPISELIGDSDDLSFKDVLPLWRDEGVSEKDFDAWAGNKDNLLAFMKLAHEKLRPPAISSGSVWWGPSEGSDRKPPMGWRLFGQRFTYDSAIHEQVSPPRLPSRDMVRGLDIMKAFGSKTADSLLASSDYPRMGGLEEKLDGLEKVFSGYGPDFWEKNYYNSVLFQTKSQAQFEPGAGFYFTEGAGWSKKAMFSSHGTWSELRHDTILYVKQCCAERAGDGDFDATFRTEELPKPVHYIEPNLPFWQGSVLSVQNLLSTLDKYKLLDEESSLKFGRLQEIYARAADIAALEAADKAVSDGDIEWISRIPHELTDLVLLHQEGGDITDEDQLRMALVADVYTNYNLEKVLETAVGIPYRIYVPLNDRQGGKRIAVGYIFSYYEFEQAMSERMTDGEWKKIVYQKDAKLDSYEPFWAGDVALKAEPEKSQR